jgi:hypothetical protein
MVPRCYNLGGRLQRLPVDDNLEARFLREMTIQGDSVLQEVDYTASPSRVGEKFGEGSRLGGSDIGVC